MLDTGYSQRAWGLGLLFLGGATVVTGSAFWLTGALTEDEPNTPPAQPAATLAPVIAPGWAGVRLEF
jgi:hypothetical protein